MAKPKGQENKIGKLIDTLADLNTKRIALEKEAETLKSQEKALKTDIMALLDAEGILGAKGVASVKIHEEEVPVATDWPAIWKHIQVTGDFELLHKRLGVEACRERWAEGAGIPGIDKKLVRELKLTK